MWYSRPINVVKKNNETQKFFTLLVNRLYNNDIGIGLSIQKYNMHKVMKRLIVKLFPLIKILQYTFLTIIRKILPDANCSA